MPGIINLLSEALISPLRRGEASLPHCETSFTQADKECWQPFFWPLPTSNHQQTSVFYLLPTLPAHCYHVVYYQTRVPLKHTSGYNSYSPNKNTTLCLKRSSRGNSSAEGTVLISKFLIVVYAVNESRHSEHENQKHWPSVQQKNRPPPPEKGRYIIGAALCYSWISDWQSCFAADFCSRSVPLIKKDHSLTLDRTRHQGHGAGALAWPHQTKGYRETGTGLAEEEESSPAACLDSWHIMQMLWSKISLLHIWFSRPPTWCWDTGEASAWMVSRWRRNGTP